MMKVSDVMTREVLTVNPHDSVLDVGNLLLQKKVSSAVVLVDKKFAGIISKESFVKGISGTPDKPLDKCRVEDFMEKVVETASPDDDLATILEKFLTSPKPIDRMPVLSNGRLVGIISKGSIVKLFADSMKGKFRVKDLMEFNPVMIYDYTPVRDVMKKMASLGIKRVVVVLAGEKVVGILTVMDLSIAIFRKKKEHPDRNVLLMLTVKDVMKPGPITITGNSDAAEAAAIMIREGIGGIPVVNGKLEGLITKTSIVKGYQMCLR